MRPAAAAEPSQPGRRGGREATAPSRSSKRPAGRRPTTRRADETADADATPGGRRRRRGRCRGHPPPSPPPRWPSSPQVRRGRRRQRRRQTTTSPRTTPRASPTRTTTDEQRRCRRRRRRGQLVAPPPPSSPPQGRGRRHGAGRPGRDRRPGPRAAQYERRLNEITAVEGSTRLEAKKQRRREGRAAGRRRAPIVTEAEFLARRESVERSMVIRTREDLTQIAVSEDNVLVEHYVAQDEQISLIGNVYLGRVQNVLPSMEAAFIDIGKGRNAVLYAGEVDWATLGGGQRPAQDRVGAEVRPVGPGPGHQGPDRPQGRPADQPDQPARPVRRVRAARRQRRDQPQAARHRAEPAEGRSSRTSSRTRPA